MAATKGSSMIRAAAGLLALFAIGYPLGVMPGVSAALLGVVAGTLCAAGILGRIRALVALGAGVAMVEYALALLLASGPQDPVGALGFGVALSLLLQTVDFEVRFRGAVVERQAVQAHVREWLETGAVAVVLGLLLTGLGGGGMIRLPVPVYPVVAALGALLALLGVVGCALQGADAARPERIDGEE